MTETWKDVPGYDGWYQLGVSQMTVLHAAKGETWTHLPMPGDGE